MEKYIHHSSYIFFMGLFLYNSQEKTVKTKINHWPKKNVQQEKKKSVHL